MSTNAADGGMGGRLVNAGAHPAADTFPRSERLYRELEHPLGNGESASLRVPLRRVRLDGEPAHELAKRSVLRRVHENHRWIFDRLVDQLDHGAASRNEGPRIETGIEHVLEAAQRVKSVLRVVIERSLVPHALPDRVRIVVDRVVVRIVDELCRAGLRAHAALCSTRTPRPRTESPPAKRSTSRSE